MCAGRQVPLSMRGEGSKSETRGSPGGIATGPTWRSTREFFSRQAHTQETLLAACVVFVFLLFNSLPARLAGDSMSGPSAPENSWNPFRRLSSVSSLLPGS